MILRLGVCAPAIEEISEQTGAAYARIVHTTLAEFLAAHGHLVMSNSKEMLDIVRLANASPSVDPSARRIWSILIQELRKQGRIQVLVPGSACSLAEISYAAQLADTWSVEDAPKIAMVPNALLKQIFPGAGGKVTDPSTGVMLANPAEFLDSEPVQQLKILRDESRLPFGATRKSFWELVLAPLVGSSKVITIYDRYLFSELTRRGQFLPSPTQPNEALVWILRLLDSQAPDGLVVRLFAGTEGPPQRGPAQHPDSAHQALEILSKAWARPNAGAISRVEILAGPWKQRGKLMPHDRHIRFGENRAISIPAGLDRLKAPTVQETAGMAWKYHWSTQSVAPLISTEKELESGHFTDRVVL